MSLQFHRRRSAIFRRFCAAFLLISTTRAATPPPIPWQPWSNSVFKQAAAQHKLVILDLEAVWCHWCHVMDGVTYSDPEVIALIAKGYIPVRVDQDSRPDLANRYADYGWPATILFKRDGSELARRRGYIPPMPMASMLQAFIDDPTPGPSVTQETPEPTTAPAGEGALSKDRSAAALQKFTAAYDGKLGGWGSIIKYIDWDAIEFCLWTGTSGSWSLETMARQTLTAGQKLIDPVWGGVDQYSVDGDWDHPHYEKIMPFQAGTMRIYSMAASLWHEPQSLAPAEKIHGYLETFLTSPEGAFYTSQDADPIPGKESSSYFALGDAARRKIGLPRVDTHIYARENGLAITGLAALYAANGDSSALAEARAAATWVLAHRALPGSGFSHDETDPAGPYLADTLEMGRAFLALYNVTAERPWLAHAEAAADFIDAKFQGPIGYVTSATGPAAALKPEPVADENATLVRFANMLGQYSGKPAYHAMAQHAMAYLATPPVLENQGFSGAGIFIAYLELSKDPTHITIVGAKSDPAARALFTTALADAPQYTRLEWYDPAEGPLPNPDVQYPALPIATAFLCTANTCSTPMTTPDALATKLASLNQTP
jgi:hypothetical protein